MKLEIKVLAWDRHTNVAGLNQLMESQPSLIDPCFQLLNKITIYGQYNEIGQKIQILNYQYTEN
jgi:hypothetical protein